MNILSNLYLYYSITTVTYSLNGTIIYRLLGWSWVTVSSSTARTCWPPTWISWFQRSNRRSSMMTSRWGIKRAQLLGRVVLKTQKIRTRNCEWSKIYTISIPIWYVMICIYIYTYVCVIAELDMSKFGPGSCTASQCSGATGDQRHRGMVAGRAGGGGGGGGPAWDYGMNDLRRSKCVGVESLKKCSTLQNWSRKLHYVNPTLIIIKHLETSLNILNII